MRAAALGALTLGLTVASLGIAQSLPTPAVPSTPTLLEKFVTWVKTPPKAAIPRSQRQAEEEKATELPAAPAPGEFGAPQTEPPVRRAGWLRSTRKSTVPEPETTKTPGEIPLPPTPAVGGIELTAAPTSAPAFQQPMPTPVLAQPAPVPEPQIEQAPQPAQLPPPTPFPPEGPRPAPTAEVISLEPTLGFNDAAFVYNSPGAYWTSVEYLIWKTQHGPLAYPLATASLTTGSSTGAVGSTGVVTFFDKTNMTYPWYSGVRLTAGLWLDACERTGLEASGFFVNTPGIHFKAVASATQPSLSGPAGPQGTIAIYEPFINVTTGKASAQVIGAQTFSTGFINIDSTSNLNGAELNLVRNMYRGPECRIELLGGYRYLNLKETLDITSDTNATGTTTSLTKPNQFVIMDNFGTRNQFNGGQMGARVGWQRDCFRCSVMGKMAFGVTQEYGSINGATTFFSSSTAPVTTASGIYAQPSNIGSFTRQQFAVVPQLGMTLGYQAGKHCYFYFGYDFLYWSRVARPGDMINPALNPATIVSNPSFSSSATSINPAPLFPSRDFWAQGVDMGLEVKY